MRKLYLVLSKDNMHIIEADSNIDALAKLRECNNSDTFDISDIQDIPESLLLGMIYENSIKQHMRNDVFSANP